MKNTVMDVVKTAANAVSSFGGFMFIVGLALMPVAFIYLLITSMSLPTAQNAACLKAGMVRVHTDGGNFCVAPTHLVEIK